MPLCTCFGSKKSPSNKREKKEEKKHVLSLCEEKDEKKEKDREEDENEKRRRRKSEDKPIGESQGLKSENERIATLKAFSSNLLGKPAKAEFLVSFLVDARGGAMTGSRGSGLRIIIPPRAVEHPIRVTCRYVRSAERMTYPPPLMEREALASRVFEVGPPLTVFQSPILIEVPHFASLRGGERELIVLKSEDGETWREHVQSPFESGWIGGVNDEDAIYAQIVNAASLDKVYDVLETSRIVRISTKIFPKYFALLFRVKERVESIGPEGGTVTIGALKAEFTAGAVTKKIKVGLQSQGISPLDSETLLGPETHITASSLIAIEPRRRRFHESVRLTVPLSKTLTHIHLLCSLTGGTGTASWEDLSDSASLVRCETSVAFQTRVSALFWILTTNGSFSSESLVSKVSSLYQNIILPPYMVKFLVYYKPYSPHAWCDALIIFCVTDDKAEKNLDTEWSLLTTSETEIEVPNSTSLSVELRGDVEPASGISEASASELKFRAFTENFVTLYIKNTVTSKKKRNRRGQLIFRRKLGNCEESLLSLNIDLSQFESSNLNEKEIQEHTSSVAHRVLTT